MSKMIAKTAASFAGVPLGALPLGTRNPDNPKQRLLKCSSCGKERYAEIHWHHQNEVEEAGFIKLCGRCANKAAYRERRNNPILDFSCGGSVNLNERNPENDDEVEATCGICGAKHFVLRRHWKRSWEAFKSYCEGCYPLARVALRPEHALGPSSERDNIYAKVRDIRRALEAGKTLKGAKMPFCVLAKEWDEQNPQSSRGARDTQSYNIRLLSFYFGTASITDVDLDAGMKLRRFLLELPPMRGAERGSARSEISVNQTLATLRLIISFAVERRWLSKNPLPVGGEYTPSRRVRKATPLVTVDDETRLLSACTGTLAYLREMLVCLIDTGMEDAIRQRLKWRDVDFNASLIKGNGVPMAMTPRLRSAMLVLFESSDRDPDSLIWSGRDSSITRFKRDLGSARLAARIQGLYVKYLRPTAAWRMAQAGREFLYIASVLGCSAEKLQQYLETDPETAEQESNSPSFKQFLSHQFGALVNSRDNEKNEGTKKRSHGGARNIKWTPEHEEEFLTRYEEALPKIRRRDQSIPHKVIAELLLPGNSPSDVARDFVAQQMGVESNEYLRTLITRARKRRKQNTLHSKSILNVA